jgi:hypothetical protein
VSAPPALAIRTAILRREQPDMRYADTIVGELSAFVALIFLHESPLQSAANRGTKPMRQGSRIMSEGWLLQPDKRNAAVVAALVASITVGVVTLLALEPQPPAWEAANLGLTAVARIEGAPSHRAESVRISYVPDQAAAAQLPVAGDETVIYIASGEVQPSKPIERGSRYRFVVCCAPSELDDATRAEVVSWLGWLNQGRRPDLVPVQLADDYPVATPAAGQLRDFLRSKGLLRE